MHVRRDDARDDAIVKVDAAPEASPGAATVYGFPTFSPDGKRIAYSAETHKQGEDSFAVWVYDLARSDAMLIFESRSERIIYMVWLPDAQHLSFLLGEPQGLSLVLAEVKESTPVRIVTTGMPLYFDWGARAPVEVQRHSGGDDSDRRRFLHLGQHQAEPLRLAEQKRKMLRVGQPDHVYDALGAALEDQHRVGAREIVNPHRERIFTLLVSLGRISDALAVRREGGKSVHSSGAGTRFGRGVDLYNRIVARIIAPHMHRGRLARDALWLRTFAIAVVDVGVGADERNLARSRRRRTVSGRSRSECQYQDDCGGG